MKYKTPIKTVIDDIGHSLKMPDVPNGYSYDNVDYFDDYCILEFVNLTQEQQEYVDSHYEKV